MDTCKTVRAVVTLVAVMIGGGCVTHVPVDDDTYALERELNAWETVVDEPIGDVYQAVLAGLEDLDVEPLVSRVDKLTGLVDGIFSDGSDFAVTLHSIDQDTTRMRIRCGMVGDRQRAKRLFRAFEKHW